MSGGHSPSNIPIAVAVVIADRLAARERYVESRRPRGSPGLEAELAEVRRRYSRVLALLGPAGNGIYGKCAACGRNIYRHYPYIATSHGPMHTVCFDIAQIAFRNHAPDVVFTGEDLAAVDAS